MHLLAVTGHGSARQVDAEPVAVDHGLLLLAGAASQVRLEPRDQLARPEGLGHVVVGSGRERRDLRVLLADGGEDDHGHLTPLAQTAA